MWMATFGDGLQLISDMRDIANEVSTIEMRDEFLTVKDIFLITLSLSISSLSLRQKVEVIMIEKILFFNLKLKIKYIEDMASLSSSALHHSVPQYLIFFIAAKS
jgi:hypothetical protein